MQELFRPPSKRRAGAARLAAAALAVLWAIQLAATWGAWGSLTIDSGHEMYVPAQLAQGKVLYRDVWFPYGPAAPYFNAALFRLFGARLEVLYWAGSLSALGSALLLFRVGMRLSAGLVGWTAGAVVLLQAFQPSVFCFPLPYSFAAVYGCLVACLFLGLAVEAAAAEGSGWVLGAGTAAAVALLTKPEFGFACYAVLVLLVAVRGARRRSWRVARDLRAVVPGLALCGLVIGWMASLGGVEFITRENLAGWPTSYFMKTYGRVWLERNGFTLSLAAFQEALLRAIPVGAVLSALLAALWKAPDRRARLAKAALLLVFVVYVAWIGATGSPRAVARLVSGAVFPQDMALYVCLAAVVAWHRAWTRRGDDLQRSAAVALLLTFSGLLACRVLMRMLPREYPIYYNGPAVLSFLLLVCLAIRRCGRSPGTVILAQRAVCAACLVVVALATTRAQAEARDYVPLTTDRGTIRVPRPLAAPYEAAIRFVEEKTAQGVPVLSIPEDTSLYFLSGSECPTRVFLFTPGVVAPGTMTEKTIREIERAGVGYLLWSNRVFPGYGTPVFGRDFNRELGRYLKSRYRRVGPLVPPDQKGWNVDVWERAPVSAPGRPR